jgi:hypothetical protein
LDIELTLFLHKHNLIRLITLWPGKFDDEIQIDLDHTTLQVPDPAPLPEGFLAEDDLWTTLPEGWDVYQTQGNGAFLFGNESSDGEFSWSHPIHHIERSWYTLPEDWPYPGFTPRYEVLSYTWGSPGKTDCVAVRTSNGLRALSISHNLTTALRHLRDNDQPSTFWIDAICINQDDLDERSEQVGKTRAIFKMARRVVVWLGPGSSDSKRALDTFSSLGSQVGLTKESFQFPIPGCSNQDWFLRETDIPFTDQQWNR